MNTNELHTGDIIGVKGNKWLSKRIQDFQYLTDPESHFINHTGIIYIDEATGEIYVIESDFGVDFKLRAFVKPTPLSEYLAIAGIELYLFTPNIPEVDLKILTKWIFRYLGYPYDYKNLLGDQIILKLSKWIGLKLNRPDFEIWLGRKGRAKKRLICHEYAQLVYYEATKEVLGEDRALFKEFYKGKISELFSSEFFTVKKIK